MPPPVLLAALPGRPEPSVQGPAALVVAKALLPRASPDAVASAP